LIKRLFFLSIAMGAIGVPYLLSSSSEMWTNFKARFRDDGQKQSSPNQAAAPGSSPQQQLPLTPVESPFDQATDYAHSPAKRKAIEGLPTQDLSEVLNFGGTPAWVTARWPRVTTGLAQPDLQGYRVPLVTGKTESDLAGSLTYYFDAQQQVKFITFHGVTGDPRKLVALVMQKYGFKPEPTDDPSTSLYLVKWNGKPMSELVVRTARVLRADQPNTRYSVDLALKRP
jgi:hypothetical protein